ncbi:response regulator [Paenibacillus whitsoniae]|uniref:Response regulator n=1 Tax=Paenibacillus whitsoniae TaxID=2496558 RepID=A0A430JEF0_9BACL|nr:response regulator [Paenibacillus whitsoniae]RTE09354.1 response regulator [Paenibacillus whitsoniae]
MFTLLIVEDEPLIRTGLQHYFDWQALGVTRILDADNGGIGLQTALRERPDLIITDIRMPEMDGLQMLEKLRSALPDTLFIILTGFNDFDYAQRAIRLGGVHDFLLKPLEYEESLATLMNAIGTLNTRRQAREEREQLVRQANTGLGHSMVKALLDEEIAVWEMGLQELLGGLDERPVQFQPFALTWLPADGASFSRKWFREEADKLTETALAALYGAGPTAASRVLLYADGRKAYAVAVLDAGAQMSGDAARDLTLPAGWFVACGQPATGAASLPQALHDADSLLYRRFCHPERRLFLAGSEQSAVPSGRLLLANEDRQRLLDAMQGGQPECLQTLMQRLAQELRDQLAQATMDQGFAYVQEIIAVAIRFAHLHAIPVEGIYSEKLLKLTCVDDFATLEGLFDWLAAWMVHVSAVYQANNSSAQPLDTQIFEHIEAYIKAHIDQDITLQMVADRFFYNPSYLSRIFKRRLNKNYMRFVTEIRIGYAMECLKQPDYLVTDVCTMCGYKSYKHFVKTFRAITGKTPTDFRKKWGW